MKLFQLLLMVVFAMSCSNTDLDNTPSNSKYLSKSEVLKVLKGDEELNFEMTQEMVEREANLIPDAQFLTEDVLNLQEQSLPVEMFKGIEIADSVDLRKYDNPTILSQWNGTCTAHGMLAVMENLNCSKYKNCDHKLSERHSWEMDKNYSCKTKVNSHLKNYVALDKYWKHSKTHPEVYDINKKGLVKLQHGWYLKDNITKVIESLNIGLPIYIGMRTPSNMIKCSSGVKYSSPLSGGHAFSIVGYYHYPKEPKYEYVFILKQSWGKNCGDHGYQYMPAGICSEKDYYCIFWTFDELKFKE